MTSFPEADKHGFVFGLAGYSGSGKTTLAVGLITELAARGHRVSSIKHAHHDFDPDEEGKDSWRHRAAGVRELVVSSRNRRVKFTETPDSGETDLATLVGELAPADFVIVEGYKEVDFPKIEVWRAETGNPFLHATHPGIRLVASDTPVPDCPLPVADLNDIKAIADLVEQRLAP